MAVSDTVSEKTAPTLREWLTAGPFAVAISQGFGCEFVSLGAVLGLMPAFGTPGVLRAHLTAVSGASSGAKIAAILAHPTLSLDDVRSTMGRVRAGDVFLNWGDMVAPWRGGYLGGATMVRFMEQLWGKGLSIEALATPFATTAFDLSTKQNIVLESGDLATACQASGSFPGMFAPVERDGRRFWDLAMIYDPAGLGGLRASAFKGNHRLLQIANTDWNVRDWVMAAPSHVPHAPTNLEVVSIILRNQTRVLPLVPPGFAARGRAAIEDARSGVLAALDKPLVPGDEPGHFICYVEPSASRLQAGAEARGLLTFFFSAALVGLTLVSSSSS